MFFVIKQTFLYFRQFDSTCDEKLLSKDCGSGTGEWIGSADFVITGMDSTGGGAGLDSTKGTSGFNSPAPLEIPASSG
jgi:hypothetical protein